MTRIAYLSPLPPQTSGIADYSRELLPALGAHLDVDVFTAHPRKTDAALRERFAVYPYSALERNRAGPYDCLLYQLGNNGLHHGPIYHTLLRRPGIVVLHECVLHHMIREISLATGGARSYLEELRYAYGAQGTELGRRLLASGAALELWAHPLFERVVDRSLGVVVHSQAAKQRILASRPTTRVGVVPHHLSLDPGPSPAPPEATGSPPQPWSGPAIDDGTFVVASFGYANPAKRMEVCLRAFARLLRYHPDSVYLVVGELSRDVAELAAPLRHELQDRVVVTGRVGFPTLLRWMKRADVAVNLRHPTGGETSGTCVRLLGLGRPVIVTASGWFDEIPDDCCAKVAVGPEEEDLLTAILRALADDPRLRHQLGENARAWVTRTHAMDVSARGYAQFIADTVALEPPLFDARPPLLRPAPDDVASALLAELGLALAELGATEADDELLGDLATTLVDLDLLDR